MHSLLELFQAKIEAPFAVIAVREVNEVLTDIEYLPRGAAPLKPQTRFAREVCRQLRAYLHDPAFVFDLPFQVSGTAFQKKVWMRVRAIPAGRVLSYTEVARETRSAPRPVGGACGANRIPILIPCHRVVASRGIGGFMHARSGSPIAIKRWLLNHENPGCY